MDGERVAQRAPLKVASKAGWRDKPWVGEKVAQRVPLTVASKAR